MSFGEEAAELEPPVEKAKKMKSAYDFMENAAEPSAEFMEELKKPVKQSAKLEEMKEKAKAKEEERKKAREEQAKRQKELEEERRRKQKEQAPPETRQDAIEKMKQDIRDLSKPVVLEPVKKKEKKKSLVELEREKYGAQKRKKAKKIDDSDVRNKRNGQRLMPCRSLTVSCLSKRSYQLLKKKKKSRKKSNRLVKYTIFQAVNHVAIQHLMWKKKWTTLDGFLINWFSKEI